MTVKIAIVYHSGYGHTQKQAEAVLEGVKSFAGAEGTLFTAQEATENIGDLDAYDGIVFGSPTYMGSASADMKKFMDATSKPWFEQKWKDKVAGGFTNSGSWSGDKFNTLVQFVALAAQHSMIWVSLGLMPGNNSSKGSDQDLNRVGGYIGAMAQSNVDAPPEDYPLSSDLATARHYGQRIAEVAAKLK